MKPIRRREIILQGGKLKPERRDEIAIQKAMTIGGGGSSKKDDYIVNIISVEDTFVPQHDGDTVSVSDILSADNDGKTVYAVYIIDGMEYRVPLTSASENFVVLSGRVVDDDGNMYDLLIGIFTRGEDSGCEVVMEKSEFGAVRLETNNSGGNIEIIDHTLDELYAYSKSERAVYIVYRDTRLYMQDVIYTPSGHNFVFSAIVPSEAGAKMYSLEFADSLTAPLVVKNYVENFIITITVHHNSVFAVTGATADKTFTQISDAFAAGIPVIMSILNTFDTSPQSYYGHTFVTQMIGSPTSPYVGIIRDVDLTNNMERITTYSIANDDTVTVSPVTPYDLTPHV